MHSTKKKKKTQVNKSIKFKLIFIFTYFKNEYAGNLKKLFMEIIYVNSKFISALGKLQKEKRSAFFSDGGRG